MLREPSTLTPTLSLEGRGRKLSALLIRDTRVEPRSATAQRLDLGNSCPVKTTRRRPFRGSPYHLPTAQATISPRQTAAISHPHVGCSLKHAERRPRGRRAPCNGTRYRREWNDVAIPENRRGLCFGSHDDRSAGGRGRAEHDREGEGQ